MDFFLSFLPMIVIVGMVGWGYLRFRRTALSPPYEGGAPSEQVSSAEGVYDKKIETIRNNIRRNIILETLGLLTITLLFYILYSPASWEPVLEALGSFGKLIELDNFFLILAYGGILYIAGAVIYVMYKYYLRSATPLAEDGHLPSTEGRKTEEEGSSLSPLDELRRGGVPEGGGG